LIGIVRNTVGPEVAEREFVLQLNDGEHVVAVERFFLVRVVDQWLSRDHWTAIEIEVMTDHRWWSIDELTSTSEVVRSIVGRARRWRRIERVVIATRVNAARRRCGLD
jgi:hypothetical protein